MYLHSPKIIGAGSIFVNFNTLPYRIIYSRFTINLSIMKKLLSLLLVMSLFSFTVGNADPITSKERELLIKELKDSHDFFLKATDGLSEGQLVFKEAPEKWSIMQCMEHIALSEKLLIDMIRQSMQSPANPEKRAEVKISDEDLLKAIPDRSKKATAPEVLQPSGKFANAEEIRASFKKLRAENISYAETTQDDLRNHIMPHPAVGELDSYQWMLLLSAHSRRHTLQIEEVKTSEAYPK